MPSPSVLTLKEKMVNWIISKYQIRCLPSWPSLIAARSLSSQALRAFKVEDGRSKESSKSSLDNQQMTLQTTFHFCFCLTSDRCTTSLASVCRASMEFEAGSFFPAASSTFEASPGGLQTKHFKLVYGDS